MSFAATQVDLQIVILSEVSQTEKEKYQYDIPYMWNLKRKCTNDLIYKTDRLTDLAREFGIIGFRKRDLAACPSHFVTKHWASISNFSETQFSYFFYVKWFVDDKILMAEDKIHSKKMLCFSSALSKNVLSFKIFWSFSDIHKFRN